MWGRFLISGLAGLLIGGAAAFGLVFGPVEMGGISSGPWRTNALIGSEEASGMTRAIVARRGLLALNRQETVYFTAWEDSDGRTLDETCLYRIAFDTEPQSRWWSLTLYAQDDFLAVNGDGAPSVSADHAAASAEDPMAVNIAATRPDSPSYWISSRNAGDFSLTLRLYHPDPAISADPALAVLPAIERVSCGETG
jgi:hypothetical protein